ncbi:MAG TPA: S8 family serine peptidase, partial [Myxococcaceae bacterium]|nr:S8 family serine peptidase [Myxococcaceae bacterium]
MALLVLFGAATQSASSPPPLNTVPTYALVELQQEPTAVRYHQGLATLGKAAATADAVRQLDAVRSEQASFARALQNSSLKGQREIYRLQRIFNGILYLTAPEDISKLRALPGVKAVHLVTPQTVDNARAGPFVGIPQLWTNAGLPVHGEGIKIGVIDTGTDYTHANFGGPGTTAAYQANNPTVIEPGTFPTAKVVGGTDFAGATYNANSAATATPVPDPDPLDRTGHGSHVAGIVGGLGVNADGSTYTGNYDLTLDPTTLRIGPGAAPKALLYSLKVFGDNGGSTSLAALALEWATDPNGDGNFSDHLDVVNLSLGSDYGTSNNTDQATYTNAVLAGVSVVASAGNAADVYFITGSPAATPEVISVAASSVGEYLGVLINAPATIAGLKQGGGAAFGPALLTPVTGNVVASVPAIGCTPLTNAAAIAGNIALIARGTCSFKIKALQAQSAGAIGVIITNNAAGPPVGMGDDVNTPGPVAIPARMISLTDGNAVNAELTAGNTVNATLDDLLGFTVPAELDLIAGFSSRGPSRQLNRVNLKPDLTAPGVNIVSTSMGTGGGGTQLSGTSM